MVGQQIEVTEPSKNIQSSRVLIQERLVGPCGIAETTLNEVFLGKCLVDARTVV